MPARLVLENFDLRPAASDSLPSESEDAVEDIRLAAYEKGYSAGWDDSVSAQSDDQMRIRDDLSQNLRDLSFTYQEARSHLLRGLEPLLRGMVDRILPTIMHETIGASVVAELIAEADRLASASVEIAVSPENRPAIEAAVGEIEALSLSVVEDASLTDGQVHMRFGEEERSLDLEALVTSIKGLVTQFLESSSDERVAAHG